MIDLQQYKAKRLERFNQLIVLDETGKVVQSCNAIFDTYEYSQKSICHDIPFLDSIFDIINEIPLNSPEILFSKVESSFRRLIGVYDFTFSKILIAEKAYILWAIYDFTTLYKDLIDYQQRYNDLEIKKQLSTSVLESLAKYPQKSLDVKAMIDSLNQKENIQYFELYSSIQSVLDAFVYINKATITQTNAAQKKKMYGDVTWFKFMLYHLLDNVISTYQMIDIQLHTETNDALNSTYLKIRFSFFGAIKNPIFFKKILANPNINTNNLTNEEHVFLSKLYSIQKIVHQGHGYLEFKPADDTYEQLTTVLVFNFHFKQEKE